MTIVTSENVNVKYTNPTFYPPKSRVPALDVFQSRVENDLVSLKRKNTKQMSSHNLHHNNLSREHRKALTAIRDNPYLVVKRADKGGSVVVFDKGLYRQLALDSLTDTSTYRLLTTDPSTVFRDKLEVLLSEGVAIGAITEKEKRYLCPAFPIIAIFHGLPKLHKEVFPPALRPIISMIGPLNEHDILSSWTDSHLQQSFFIFKQVQHIPTRTSGIRINEC